VLAAALALRPDRDQQTRRVDASPNTAIKRFESRFVVSQSPTLTIPDGITDWPPNAHAEGFDDRENEAVTRG